MLKIKFIIFSFLINTLEFDAQELTIFRPGLFSYNLLNAATGGLTEALTGGSQIFKYGQRDKNQNLQVERPINNQQGSYQQQSYRPQNNYQPSNNYQPQQNYKQPSNYQNFQPAPQVIYAPAPTTQPPRIIYVPAPTAAPVYIQQTAPPQIQNYNENNFNDRTVECGVPEYHIPSQQGLVVGGKAAIRGQFPWLAAFYIKTADISNFICGGNLISTKLIVTAAHCVQDKFSKANKAEDATFYLGKHNLETLQGEQNYVVSGVSQFIVHPSWNVDEKIYDADIAIAVLTIKVSFSKFIKPICLWTFTQSYEDMVDKTAVVAGWGKTENNAVSTSVPKWAEIPVVSLLKCIQSEAVFGQIVSERSFCAGNVADGSGPCNGDSGGGLLIRNGNKWYLRGIVSAGTVDITLNMCNPRNYVVFADASKFTTWIQGHIQTYG